MALTPETLPKHELVGLHVRVVEATDPARVGVEGRVVDETANTLLVEAETDSGVTQVPKRGATFEFRIDEAAAARKGPGTASEPAGSGGVDEASASPAGDGAAYVTVDGAVLRARPAERTENGVDSKWR